MTSMNIEKIYQLQDKIIDEIGKLNKEMLFSGSTLLSRGYLAHRETDNLEFYVPEDTDLEKLLEDIKKSFQGKYLIKDLKIENLYTFPKSINCISFSISEITDFQGKNKVNVHICHDPFFDDFDKHKLENGLYVSDIEGIMFRKLIKFINNPEDILALVDIAYIDNELHLIDFIEVFQEKLLEKGFKFNKNTLIEKLQKAVEYISTNENDVEKILKKYGINLKIDILIKWINAKIEELQD